VGGYAGAMAALRKHVLARMTLDEFLAWDPHDASGRTWQLIDGEPVAMAPGTDAHGSIQAEIAALLRNHLLERGGPCRVVTEPGIVPHVRANRNYRVPDLGVTCASPTRDAMMPEPVLLIEILSPSNEAETWSNIWAYTTIPSVTEILAVRSTRIEAEYLHRGPDGSWPKEPEIIGGGASLTLRSISFAVPLAAFYRTTILGAG
jgi:Uma2 family endonuclease